MMTSSAQVVTTRWRVNEKMRAITLFRSGDLLKTMQVLLLHMCVQFLVVFIFPGSFVVCFHVSIPIHFVDKPPQKITEHVVFPASFALLQKRIPCSVVCGFCFLSIVRAVVRY